MKKIITIIAIVSSFSAINAWALRDCKEMANDILQMANAVGENGHNQIYAKHAAFSEKPYGIGSINQLVADAIRTAEGGALSVLISGSCRSLDWNALDAEAKSLCLGISNIFNSGGKISDFTKKDDAEIFVNVMKQMNSKYSCGFPL